MQTLELKKKLNTSIEFLSEELTKLRTGRATPGLIENITVNAYGANMTIKEVGSVTVPDSQLLVISPWDKSLLKNIEKSIRESDLNLNPVVDGDIVRVSIPSLTEERRKEFAKIASSKVEECKQAIRNVRQDAMKAIDKKYADKLIGEDEKFTQREEVEDVVKEYVSKAESLGEAKKKDILTV
ncbi:MAG: ribosome recycling factor [Patescibacteria group bacterium]